MLFPSLTLLTLTAQGKGLVPNDDPKSLVTVTATPLTPVERDRIRKERGKATRRDDGSPLVCVEQGEFQLVLERRLLPDDLTAIRTETLDALSREWAAGGAISLRGKSSGAYARGIVGQLQAEFRPDIRASGAFLITRKASLILAGQGRREMIDLDRNPALSDELYPVGDVTPPPPASDEAERKAAALPPPERVAESFDGGGPVTQSKGFDVAFRFLAERWRRDGEMLREKYATLDRALNDDLARRNPYGLPKEGTAFTDLDPGLQSRFRDQYANNWKALGFDSKEAAVGWIDGTKVDFAWTHDFCGFGRWDNGRGGVFAEIRLFTP